MPWVAVLAALKIAADDRGEETIVNSVASRLSKNPTELGPFRDLGGFRRPATCDRGYGKKAGMVQAH